MWSPPPSSLVPVCVPPKQKPHAPYHSTYCSMSAKCVMAFSVLFCESQNSHGSVLMQNATTFSNRTSLSQEVNRKHIAHCVSAAQILLMAKTPWRQIDLSLFRELWGKRKYIWHIFSGGEESWDMVLDRIQSCLEEWLCVFRFLLLLG